MGNKASAVPKVPQSGIIKQWNVTLRKQGKLLGVDVDLVDGHCLFIETIKPGLVQDWNAAHPDQAIAREDCIIQVNGIKSDQGASALTAACKKDEVLELVVVRLSEEARKLRREQYPMDSAA